MSNKPSTNGKGSKRRPGDEQAYRDNWDNIFRKFYECSCCGEQASGHPIPSADGLCDSCRKEFFETEDKKS